MKDFEPKTGDRILTRDSLVLTDWYEEIFLFKYNGYYYTVDPKDEDRLKDGNTGVLSMWEEVKPLPLKIIIDGKEIEITKEQLKKIKEITNKC